MKNKGLYIAVVFLLSCSLSKAQVFNVRLGLGIMSYKGDLVSERLSFSDSHAAIRAGFGLDLFPRLALEVSYLGGKVSSKNVPNIDSLKLLNFNSKIGNYSFLVKFRLDKMNFHKNRWGLSILFGGGMVMFDPIENVANTRVILSENQREGVAYDLQANEYNLGGEISYMITRRWIISLQSIYHGTSTDYLDDVSLRKDPKNNDSYMDHTLSMLYRFGPEKGFKNLQAPVNCPAFLK